MLLVFPQALLTLYWKRLPRGLASCPLFSLGSSHWEHLQKAGVWGVGCGDVELWLLHPLDLWVCILFLVAPSWQLLRVSPLSPELQKPQVALRKRSLSSPRWLKLSTWNLRTAGSLRNAPIRVEEELCAQGETEAAKSSGLAGAHSSFLTEVSPSLLLLPGQGVHMSHLLSREPRRE